MVVLEVALVAASTWLAYWHLNDMIEESLYRVHLEENGLTLKRLMEEALAVLGLFTVVNVIALMLAAAIWSRHENHVLQDLSRLIAKTRALDFSSDAQSRQQPGVLALAAAWRDRERARFTAIREQVMKLEIAGPSEDDLQQMRNTVENLHRILS